MAETACPAQIAPAAGIEVPDLDDPRWYLNRELTWLEFNRRVLHEAEDPTVPLLERVRFLCISCTNLDEFFEVRVASVRQRLQHGATPAGRARAGVYFARLVTPAGRSRATVVLGE